MLNLIRQQQSHVAESGAQGPVVEEKYLLRSLKLQNDGNVTYVDTHLTNQQLLRLVRGLMTLVFRQVGPENIHSLFNHPPQCDHCGKKLDLSKQDHDHRLQGQCKNKDCDLHGQWQEAW